MSGQHPWPNGYISGWCSSQLVADHARCPLQHTTDRAAPGCHCAPCALPVTLITPEPAAGDPVEAFLSDTTMDAAVAPPAEQPGATAAITSVPEPPVPSVLRPDGTIAVDAVELAKERARLDAVLELHAPLRPIRPGGTGSANCAHCGRHHPCPTRRLALGEVA